jgi:hypothetical protein
MTRLVFNPHTAYSDVGGTKAFNPQADAAIADRPKAISPLWSINISKIDLFSLAGLFDLVLS